MATDDVLLAQGFSSRQRDIGHLVEGGGAAHVQPLRELLTRETLQADSQRYVLQFL